MNEFEVDIYNLPALLAALGNVGLGWFVFSRDRKNPTYQAFAALNVTLAVWNIGFFLLMGLPPEAKPLALLFDRILHLGLVFLPSIAFHFVLLATRQLTPPRLNLLRVFYFLSTVFLFIALSDHFVSDLVYYLTYGGFFFPIPGPGSKAFDLFFLMAVGLGFYYLWRHWRCAQTLQERLRTQYLIIALLVACSSGIPNFLLLSGMAQIYPFGHLLNFAYTMIIAYAIVHHKLLDIEFVIRKTIVYGGVFALLYAAYFGVVYLGEQMLRPLGSSLLTTGALVTMVLSCQYLLRRVQEIVDRIFLRNRPNYQQTLRAFSKEVVTHSGDLHSLLEFMRRTLTEDLYVQHAQVLLYDKTLNCYLPAEHVSPLLPLAAGGRREKPALTLATDRGLPALLRRYRRELLAAEVRQLELSEAEREEVQQGFEQLQAKIVVPILLQDQLLGLLAIGENQAERGYTQEDLDTFVALAHEAAAALQNAQLVQQLQATYEYALRVIETMPVGVCSVDQRLTISAWNRTMADLSNISAEAVLNRSLTEVAENNGGWPGLEVIRAALKTGEPQSVYDLEFPLQNGAKRIVNLYVSPLQEGEEIVEAVAVYEDITERQQLEQELNEAQRLAYAGQLAANVSHEIKNVLLGISGYVQMIQRKRKEYDPKTLERLDIILQSSNRCRDLILALLSVSRSSMDPASSVPRPVNLTQVLKEVKELILGLRDAKGIDIQLVMAEPELVVKGIFNELHQVFLNLTTNALQAMHNRGTLRLEARAHNGFAEVQVCDDGDGIPPEILPRIFDRYFTTKQDRGGTGLGLFNCQEIIQRHQGTIEVESQVGVGSTFTVKLPLLTTSPANG
ncbi:MAG TPA: PAS domain S-box protein [Armatimonadetes bacterium]|nr:PAS domain S-box protein [Armatimonadota bacterium]